MGLIKKPNELTVKNALSALIYGQPGMGKDHTGVKLSPATTPGL